MASSEIQSDVYEFSNVFDFLNTTNFSDFEVVCGDFTFKVHRIIICQRCKYFKNLNGVNWMETKDAKATFTDEEPAIIARLLIFLYRGTYPEQDIARSGIKQFETIDDPYRFPGKLELLHAKMYALASMLDLRELFDAARIPFKRTYQHDAYIIRDEWADLVQYVYTSTSDSTADSHLRRIMLKGMQLAICYDTTRVRPDNLRRAIHAAPDFGFDIAMTCIGGESYTCNNCGRDQKLLFD